PDARLLADADGRGTRADQPDAAGPGCPGAGRPRLAQAAGRGRGLSPRHRLTGSGGFATNPASWGRSGASTLRGSPRTPAPRTFLSTCALVARVRRARRQPFVEVGNVKAVLVGPRGGGLAAGRGRPGAGGVPRHRPGHPGLVGK